jgi:uncharacterized protein (DUF2336 family)
MLSARLKKQPYVPSIPDVVSEVMAARPEAEPDAGLIAAPVAAAPDAAATAPLAAPPAPIESFMVAPATVPPPVVIPEPVTVPPPVVIAEPAANPDFPDFSAVPAVTAPPEMEEFLEQALVQEEVTENNFTVDPLANLSGEIHRVVDELPIAVEPEQAIPAEVAEPAPPFTAPEPVSVLAAPAEAHPEPAAPPAEQQPVVEAAEPQSATEASTAQETVEEQELARVIRLIHAAPSLEDRTAYLQEVAELEAARLSAVEAPAVPDELLLPQEAPAEIVATPEVATRTENLMEDGEAAELARSLLDMMSSGGSSLPQERALAADTLLRLVPRLPLKSLVLLADRLSIMEQPHHLLVNRLIRDPRIEVSGPLLENCTQITDEDLQQVISEGEVPKQRMIARRRKVTRAVSNALLATREPSVLLTLIRNAGAEISHEGFSLLTEQAAAHEELLPPLCTRADLGAPTAFELFWLAPAQLRRYLLTRFLTDSETLTKILKITLASQGGDDPSVSRSPAAERVDAALDLVRHGKLDEGAEALGECAQIGAATAMRIICDRQGEPLSVLLKAIAYPRAQVLQALDVLQRSDFGIIDGDRDLTELQALFESLSFNKARVLITYWDWAVLKTGPYAPGN